MNTEHWRAAPDLSALRPAKWLPQLVKERASDPRSIG